MMKRICTLILVFIAVLSAFASNDNVVLRGRVKDSVTKRDLFKAYVKTYDKDGNVKDSIACKSRSWVNNELDSVSSFYLSLPRVDSVISFDVVCPGYNDKTITYDLGTIGKREQYKNLPLILLERAPRTLGEVTVTTTKIKFYNKGDTLVYNADAFQLAEGSMLDQLIAQLPGVELSDNGQIKVNGQFVESLLLNGRQFMDGNNNLMLENIAAYTVKDVNIYEGQTKLDKRQGNVNAPKVLTMDVRLKKEYNYGWMGNIQGGYGTEDRYMGRAFASWFNATTRLSLIGNVNNLNDNRKPGRNDSWTPEKMPSGTKEYRLAGFDYNYEAADESESAEGSVVFEQSVNNTRRTTSRINFLPGGDTYDYSRSKARDRETGVRTNHTFSKFLDQKKISLGLSLDGDYSYQKNINSDLSATFNKEQQGSVNEILDAMYSDGSADKMNDVINRNDTRADGWTKTLNGSVGWYMNFKMPGSDDNLGFSVITKYNGVRNELWNDYNVLFDNPEPSALNRRNYTDNTPNHNVDVTSSLRYNTSFGDLRLNLTYFYLFADRTKDSYMYALDRLNDMGVYGVVPADYLESFDPGNSYESRLIKNQHMVNLGIFYYKSYQSSYFQIRINPQLGVIHRHLDYYRDGKDYRYAHTNVILTVPTIFDGMIECGFQKSKSSRYGYHRNVVRYSYRVTPRLPEVEDMIDIVNDADPMNIYYGNPALKPQIAHAHLFRWAYVPESHSLQNYLYIGYNHTTNNLTRGYTYDTETGVRYNRMYNVDGNNRAAVTNELNMQFGAKKQFTLSSTTDIVSSNSTDMIGTDGETPELSKVHQNSFSENVRMGWQVGKQFLQVRCDYTTRHTTSTRPDFETLNAWHVNYGVSGVFALPAGFGVSTDFMCYTRRGYGSSQLDTTDPVWNARLTFSPVRNKHWVLNLDGFDLLHKLSNVTYAVTASGRTVAYTNALPRYVLATVQYRFSIQPKK